MLSLFECVVYKFWWILSHRDSLYIYTYMNTWEHKLVLFSLLIFLFVFYIGYYYYGKHWLSSSVKTLGTTVYNGPLDFITTLSLAYHSFSKSKLWDWRRHFHLLTSLVSSAFLDCSVEFILVILWTPPDSVELRWYFFFPRCDPMYIMSYRNCLWFAIYYT